MRVLKGYINALPPSVNRMYRNGAFGRKVPTKELQIFKSQSKMKLMKQWLAEEPLKDNVPYTVSLTFYIPDMENKGWPKSAKSRFKKKDVSNLIKAVEDVVADACGVDDKNFVEMTVTKVAGVEPGVLINIVELSEDVIYLEKNSYGEEIQWDPETARLREICVRT